MPHPILQASGAQVSGTQASGTHDVVRPRRPRAVVPLQPATYTARLALDPVTRQDAFQLRYDSYHAAGFIPADPSGLFSDPYDALPNCQTLVIYDDAVPVASVRSCILTLGSRDRSPGADTFPEEVAELLEQAARRRAEAGLGGSRTRGVEMNRLVRSPAAENNQGLVFLLYRMAGYMGMAHGAEMFMACVRQNHMAFYRRLGGAPVTGLRPYPGLNCQMLLMASDREEHDRIRAAFPVLDPYAGTTHGLERFADGGQITLSLRTA